MPEEVKDIALEKAGAEAKAWWERVQALLKEFKRWDCKVPCRQCPFYRVPCAMLRALAEDDK